MNEYYYRVMVPLASKTVLSGSTQRCLIMGLLFGDLGLERGKKVLSNNLINLGLYDEVKEVLAANGKELAEIEEIELEPSLGNGGLGRLAACFLDSI